MKKLEITGGDMKAVIMELKGEEALGGSNVVISDIVKWVNCRLLGTRALEPTWQQILIIPDASQVYSAKEAFKKLVLQELPDPENPDLRLFTSPELRFDAGPIRFRVLPDDNVELIFDGNNFFGGKKLQNRKNSKPFNHQLNISTKDSEGTKFLLMSRLSHISVDSGSWLSLKKLLDGMDEIKAILWKKSEECVVIRTDIADQKIKSILLERIAEILKRT